MRLGEYTFQKEELRPFGLKLSTPAGSEAVDIAAWILSHERLIPELIQSHRLLVFQGSSLARSALGWSYVRSRDTDVIEPHHDARSMTDVHVLHCDGPRTPTAFYRTEDLNRAVEQHHTLLKKACTEAAPWIINQFGLKVFHKNATEDGEFWFDPHSRHLENIKDAIFHASHVQKAELRNAAGLLLEYFQAVAHSASQVTWHWPAGGSTVFSTANMDNIEVLHARRPDLRQAEQRDTALYSKFLFETAEPRGFGFF